MNRPLSLDFAEVHDITATITLVYYVPWGRTYGMNRYRCILKYQGRRFVYYYVIGSLGAVPTIADVLDNVGFIACYYDDSADDARWHEGSRYRAYCAAWDMEPEDKASRASFARHGAFVARLRAFAGSDDMYVKIRDLSNEDDSDSHSSTEECRAYYLAS